MEEAEDEPLFCERAAGIDIGKQAVMVTVRVPSETRRGGRAQETREFGTTCRQLLELADWLRSWGVERAGMESTSDYWKPVFFLLEQQGFDCVLYQASKVKALPGRPKTDPLLALGLSSKREITRTRVRVRAAMAAQTREQGRYLGGRPPYGYRLADAGPHPNKAHAAWGRRAHRLEPDPATAPVVTWMFSQRLAGHSAARITRALNDAGVPCPSAADPARNPHRTGAAWTLRTVAAILANPRYPGRQVWNRQRTDFDLADPANTTLGHRQVQRWNLPEGWVISRHPAHAALVSEADFISAQDMTVPRGPAGPAARQYLLAGLLACGVCGRRLESAWSNGKPAYRCRHGYASAAGPEPGRPPNTYVREDQILPHLAAIAILLAGPAGTPVLGNGGLAQLTGPDDAAALIGQLRAGGTVLTYDPARRTLHAGGHDAPPVTIGTETTDTHARHGRERRTA